MKIRLLNNSQLITDGKLLHLITVLYSQLIQLGKYSAESHQRVIYNASFLDIVNVIRGQRGTEVNLTAPETQSSRPAVSERTVAVVDRRVVAQEQR